MAKRILIVDDSAVERQNITEILAAEGHTIFTAEDGEQSIGLAKSLRPDLIIMDVVMPGMNGFQATREITEDEDTKHIPVILCTTKDKGSDKKWGAMQGAKAYVVKPIDPDELLKAVNEA